MDGLGPRACAELAEQMGHVVLGGAEAKPQLPRNLAIAVAKGQPMPAHSCAQSGAWGVTVGLLSDPGVTGARDPAAGGVTEA